MNSSIQFLISIGVTPEMNRLERGRVNIVNSFTLIATFLCLVFIPITLIEGLVMQPIFLSLACVLFLINLLLSKKGWHQTAKYYLIIIGFILTCALSLRAFSQEFFTDTENILFGLMAVSILLFDGYIKHFLYWFLFLILIALKYIRVNLTFENADLGYLITLQNSFVLGLLLYLFLIAFFNILSKSLDDVVKKENTLNSLIDNVPIFMALLSNDNRYDIVNSNYVKAFGRPRHEIVGALIKDVLPENIYTVHGPLITRALHGESPDFIEKTEMPDGSIIYAAGKYVPIFDRDGNVQNITVFADDVTQLMQAEQKLKEELKDKDKLFSIIAHDIRSPLNLFEGLLNASDNDVLSQEEFLAFKDKLRERFISLQETINGLLEWSRLQLDRIQPVPVEFKPEEVINELISVFKPIAESKEIRIVQEGKAPLITMDINHFRIIFRNLLHNALKFTPNGGKISVNYEFKDRLGLISISDTGVGMTHESIAKILSKEEVTSATGTLGETGTGLGLHLSLELLEKNSGSMDILRNKDGGTKFIINISSLVPA